MPDYKPLMPEEEVERRRAWQEVVYQAQKKFNRKRRVSVLGKQLFVLPGMFAPVWCDPRLLAKAVRKEARESDLVLDIGTATGIQAIFAAEKGAKVTAIDINPVAVKVAELNAKKHELEGKIKVFKSDLFSNVREKFDLIVFNPPFRWFKPREMMERGNLDENYETLNRFFSQAKHYLKEDGRILLVFSDSGDIKYLERLIKANKFKSKILAKEKSGKWNYFVYRLF